MSFDQSNFRLKSDGAIGAQPGQNKLQEEATEHTIAGSVIGAVRNIIPGIKGSAQSNDQIAQIAADTIASLPMVKTVAGGGIRATMLIDPTKDWGANAGSFGLNFVEGVALNKVSKMAMPDSGFSQLVSSKLGTGLASEAATHLTVGLGFGAIRTGFNADSWKDNQGNFSLSSGAENLVKGSAMGALINLPAGMIGFRVARASSVAMENSVLSPRIASVISGIGSGYAAGGVFGGVDAVMAGKSFSDVLKGINEGGIIGAASGGLMGSFDGTRLLNSNAALKGGNVSETHTGVPLERTAVNTELPTQPTRSRHDAVDPRDSQARTETFYPANDEHFVIKAGRYEAMTIKPLEMPRIQEVQNRLTSFEVKPESYRYLEPDAVGPWKDFAEFATNLKSATKDFRVYQVDGGKTEIALPEAYAKQLDEVRALRIKAEQASLLDNLAPGQHISVQNMVKNQNVEVFRSFYNEQEAAQVLPVIWARIKLAEHPLGNRALPEDFVTLMDELPTRNNVKRLTIWDDRNSQDAWHGQEFKTPNFKAAATALESEGKVDFYQPSRSDAVNSTFRDSVRGSLFHEHGHLVPPRDNMWAEASLLEKDGHYSTQYSRHNDSERWSEDRAKAFLHTDVDKFFEFVQQAPLRSVVIANELTKQMGSTPIAEQSVYAKQIWERVKFTEEQVLPYAREQLTKDLASADVRTQQAALRMLERFGSKNEIDALLKTAGTPSGDTDVRRGAFDLALQFHSKDAAKQFDFAWEQGVTNPGLNDVAVRRLRYFGLKDERAASYANLLEVLGKNDLPGLAKQVTRMNTDDGAELAYDFAMNKGRHVQGYQRAVALSALDEVPSLRLKALGTLANQQPEFIANAVRKYVNDSDPEVAAAARDVLKGVQLRTIIQDVNGILEKGDSVKSTVLEALGNSGKTEAVPTLLQIITRGPESTRTQAIDQLAKFDPSIVKYYARLARKDLPADQAQHLQLVMNHSLSPRN
ncbi:hypothetical protein BH10CYA1_BH10CYA1_38080 [soil metagenome]